MKFGLVGLGRMGAGIAERARRGSHEVVGFDQDAALSEVESLAALTLALSQGERGSEAARAESEPQGHPPIVWLMVPAGEATQAVIDELAGLLPAGAVVIDGGNSYYRDSLRRAAQLEKVGIRFLDAGTSGGIWGLETGFCLMVGGPKEAFDFVEPLLEALAAPGGYAYLGPSGAGHYAKMVHNGIEYGLLQAFAEGFDLLHAADYDYDLARIASLWNSGSVVRSWLLELAGRALALDPGLEGLRGYVDDSGEGRWTVLEAVERGVPAPVISEALFARFASRDDNSFAMRVIAALRKEFGGHAVQST